MLKCKNCRQYSVTCKAVIHQWGSGPFDDIYACLQKPKTIVYVSSKIKLCRLPSSLMKLQVMLNPRYFVWILPFISLVDKSGLRPNLHLSCSLLNKCLPRNSKVVELLYIK